MRRGGGRGGGAQELKIHHYAVWPINGPTALSPCPRKVVRVLHKKKNEENTKEVGALSVQHERPPIAAPAIFYVSRGRRKRYNTKNTPPHTKRGRLRRREWEMLEQGNQKGGPKTLTTRRSGHDALAHTHYYSHACLKQRGLEALIKTTYCY